VVNVNYPVVLSHLKVGQLNTVWDWFWEIVEKHITLSALLIVILTTTEFSDSDQVNPCKKLYRFAHFLYTDCVFDD
jgi:hypothetical protein